MNSHYSKRCHLLTCCLSLLKVLWHIKNLFPPWVLKQAVSILISLIAKSSSMFSLARKYSWNYQPVMMIFSDMHLDFTFNILFSYNIIILSRKSYLEFSTRRRRSLNIEHSFHYSMYVLIGELWYFNYGDHAFNTELNRYRYDTAILCQQIERIYYNNWPSQACVPCVLCHAQLHTRVVQMNSK